MISLAQVVAALAAGALLTIATMLVFKLHNMGSQGERPDVDELTDGERKIEIARKLAVESVETFRQQTQAGPDLHAISDDEVSPSYEVTDEAVAARSKGHLTLYVVSGAVAALATVSTAARVTWREHRGHLVGAAISAATTGSVVTVLTLTPWTGETGAAPPRTVPSSAQSAASTRAPAPPGASLSESPSVLLGSAGPSAQPSGGLVGQSSTPTPHTTSSPAAPVPSASGIVGSILAPETTESPTLPSEAATPSDGSAETGGELRVGLLGHPLLTVGTDLLGG